MFTQIITPRFAETDALGHINNNTYGLWFEAGREPIFRLFMPELDVKKWKLIMAHSSIDFLREVFWGKEVIIKTAIAKIGNSSFEIKQAVYQDNKLCTMGKSILIHYNFTSKSSVSIPKDIKEELESHMFISNWTETLDELNNLK